MRINVVDAIARSGQVGATKTLEIAMKRAGLAFTFSLLLLAGAATAQDADEDVAAAEETPLVQEVVEVTDTAPEVEEEEDYWQQVTCKQNEVTGSRIRSRKVCATNAQWRAREEDIRRGMSRGMAGQSCPGGTC